jgi:ubiquinone/menaquinone biosynthesis C-methylase UbiE
METYTTSAPYYDTIYRYKNYATEVRTLLRLIEAHMPLSDKTLLDVACGTGGHLFYLTRYFDCTGLDLSTDLLNIARQKLPSIPFYEGDMRTFDLGQTFDVVTCLFSAVAYVRTLDNMRQAVANMARHVAPGGLLMVEPWFHPETYKPDYVSADLVETPEHKLCRMSVSKKEGSLSIIHVNYLIGSGEGVIHFIEPHEMGLFTHEEYMQAFTDAGLHPIWDEKGLIGRGLYMGLKPVR